MARVTVDARRHSFEESPHAFHVTAEPIAREPSQQQHAVWLDGRPPELHEDSHTASPPRRPRKPSMATVDGWRAEHLATAMARWAQIPDLDPEGMSIEETPLVAQLKAELTRRLASELDDPWVRLWLLRRGTLLRYLRDKSLSVEKAAARAVEVLPWLRRATADAATYEAAGARIHALYEEYARHVVFAGADRRGVAVEYLVPCTSDLSGAVAASSHDMYRCFDAYFIFFFEDDMMRASAAAGVHLMGRSVVIDLAGFEVARAWTELKVQRVLNATYPSGEAPLPSGLRITFAVGVPYACERIWSVVKHWMLSKHDRDKFQIFRSDQRAAFERELLRHVDAIEVPATYGGSAPSLAIGRTIVPPELMPPS